MIVEGDRSRKEVSRLKHLADKTETRARRTLEDLEDATHNGEEKQGNPLS